MKPQRPVMAGMHIVIVPAWWPSPESPGAGIFFQDTARAFAAAGAQVGVVYPDLVHPRHLGGQAAVPWLRRIELESLDDMPVIRVRGLHTAFRKPWLQMLRFRSWLRRGLLAYISDHGEPDVLYALCSIPAGWACTHLDHRLANCTVITEHTGPFSLVMSPDAGESYVRAALHKAAAVTTVSGRSRDEMAAAGIDREIAVCPNSVATLFMETSDRPDRSSTGAIHALFVGRLESAKGILELCEAALRVSGKIIWHLVGEGDLVAEVRGKLAAVGSGDHVHLHGNCDRLTVARLMRECDFLVHPSHGESFGLVVAEALCSGLPVVVTRETAAAEFVKQEDGIVIDAKSTESLISGLQSMIDRIGDFDRAAIARRAAYEFAPSALAEWYAACFRRVIGS